MPDQKVKVLMATWFANDSEGAMHDTWYDACTEEPETAWLAILEILKVECTEDQTALLAAGPLEDLLAWHGAAFIARVEQEAKSNDRFNHLLGGVWRSEMPEEIWERIQKARKEAW